ncbi:MAG: hypothetical protein ACRDLB_16640 [Actinomycetota bacterium]
MPDLPKLPARALLRDAFRDLVRAPFALLLGLSILATLATAPLEAEVDATALLGTVIAGVISAYVSIAITLAAAEPHPKSSAEHWIRQAFQRRCFWRSTIANLFAVVLVAAGLIALIVPGFIVGAAVAFALTGAVLENLRPGDAIRRSIETSRPARRAVGFIYGVLIIVPTVGVQASFYFLGDDDKWIWTSLGCVALILTMAAQIALARAFLALGGRVLPRTPSSPLGRR